MWTLLEETPTGLAAIAEVFSEEELDAWQQFSDVLENIEDFYDHDEGLLPIDMLRELVVTYKVLVRYGYF